jgi:hypothetical protein
MKIKSTLTQWRNNTATKTIAEKDDPMKLSANDAERVGLIEQYFLFINQPGDLIKGRGFPERSKGRSHGRRPVHRHEKGVLVSIMMTDAQKARRAKPAGPVLRSRSGIKTEFIEDYFLWVAVIISSMTL